MLNDLTPVDLALYAAVFIGVWHYFKGRTGPLQPPTAQATQIESFVTRLASLETKVEGLPSLWETERSRVEEQASLARRSAARIEQANRRAQEIRAEREDEPEPGPLASALRLSNGGGGGESFVPSVSANLAANSGLAPHKRR